MNKISKIILLVLLVVSLVIPSAVEARGRRKSRNCCSIITTAVPDFYHGCVIPCGTCHNVLHYHKVMVEHSCKPVTKTKTVKCCKPLPCCCHQCNHVVTTCYKTVVECKPVVTCRPVVVYQAAVQPVVHCCNVVPVCQKHVAVCCPNHVNCQTFAPVVMPCGKKGDSN